MEVEEKVKSVKLDMKARHEFFLIFKEALRNIAENANGSLSLINVDFSSGKLLLKIQNSEANFNSGAEAEHSKKEMKQREKLLRGNWIYCAIKRGFNYFTCAGELSFLCT